MLKSTGPGWRHALLVLLAIGLSACGGGPPVASSEEPEGTFEAQVHGALHDTLRGAATTRFDSTGRLAGIELDGARDTTLRSGFSFELVPQKLEGTTRTYAVAPRDGDAREGPALALMNAYLRLRGYAFAARAGSLRVERDSTGLHGTFGLRLRGSVEAASDEAATLDVRGQFEGARL